MTFSIILARLIQTDITVIDHGTILLQMKHDISAMELGIILGASTDQIQIIITALTDTIVMELGTIWTETNLDITVTELGTRDQITIMETDIIVTELGLT